MGRKDKLSVRTLLFFLPVGGVVTFVTLYFVAAHYYPGGSDASRVHHGFDWINNYWCDLIAKYGKNGVVNPARPIALSAMSILFSSLAVFWFRLPHYFRENRVTRTAIGYIGLLAMFILNFIFTPYHDIIIMMGGALSSIPFLTTLKELYTHRWLKLFRLGCICLLLICYNFYSYLTGDLIFLLPLIQKVTVVFFLVWVVLTSIHCQRLSSARLRKANASKAAKSQLFI